MTAPASASPPRVVAATFVAEARSADSLPPEGPPEIAIAGRSNVGKSTLLNRLADRKSLARTSKTPGRTRGLLFYDLQLSPGDATLRLVDLPGYGYAKVARAERKAWQDLVEGYTKGRRSLRLFVILVDARRGPEDEERQLAQWLASEGVPHRLVATKTDKLGASERGALRARQRGVLMVSGQTGEGVDVLWRLVAATAAQQVCPPARPGLR